MSPQASQLPDNLLQNFDADLQRFYYRVICKEITFRGQRYAENIKQAVKEIAEAYKKDNTSKSSSALRFDTRNKRCAYILKHSPCFTSAVSLHFMELVKKNIGILHEPLQRNELKVCCLGGGPASEIVAFTKILGALYSDYWMQSHRPLKLSVTIVDINEDWEHTCTIVLDNLKRDAKFEGVKSIDFSFRFIQADLSLPMNDELKDVIGSADILTMVYFLSAVNGGEDREESFSMVKDIMVTIKTGAVLFFLDSATDVHYEQMYRAAKKLRNMDVVYGPCIEDLYCLSIESVKKFLEIYKVSFKRYICMTNSFMSFCVWHKSEKCTDFDEANEKAKLEIILAGKNSPSLTSKMIDYRKKVDELLDKEFRLRKFDKVENWRENKLNTPDNPENWRINELKKPDKSRIWRENEIKIFDKSKNRREIELGKSDHFESLREIGLKNSDQLVNWRDIGHRKSDQLVNQRESGLKKSYRLKNWRERNDTVSRVNSTNSSINFYKSDPINNIYAFEKRNQYGSHHQNLLSTSNSKP